MQLERVADGVYRLCTLMVNVYYVAEKGEAWALIDTGLRGYAGEVRRGAERLFNTPPVAVLLTHGHFDHVGGLPELARDWGVPVYAHPLEMPYLTGVSPYPPPDPTVGGGAQSWISPLFPRGPIDLRGRIHALPPSGTVPSLPDWRWVATPGHSPGHVSYFREWDRLLVAGDALVTTKQESALAVMTQREVVWRPPAYYTSDWIAAERSVERLAALEPNALATGHGHVLYGERMRDGVRRLAANFSQIMPSTGRYVPYPAVTDERGLVHVPPRVGLTPAARTIVGVGLSAAAVAAAAIVRSRRARG